MKILKLTSVIFTMLALCAVCARAESENRANLCISNVYSEDAYGIIDNGTTLVPIRVINDALGLETMWSEERQCVTIDFSGGKLADMYIGGRYIYVNDNGVWREYMLGTAPQIMEVNGEDRTMVPIRFISGEMGLDVEWADPNKTVYIDSRETYEEYVNSAQYNADLYRSRAPYALMNSGGTEEWVPWNEIDERRHNGWFIKNYSLGLDALTSQIENYIAGKSGKWGVYVKNLDNGEFMVINDGQYSSASIIKLFVMAATYNEIAYGSVQKTPRVAELLKQMITVSDNYSSNQLVRINGGGSYERGFEGENAHSYSIGAINTQHKSLFSGYGDYVSYGRNLVSPLDCGIVLEQIYNGTLVSEEYSAEMLSLLKGQQRRNKIPYPLPSGTVTGNKTGETSSVESDVAIVYSPACDYVICVTTNNASDGISGIRKISSMTYDYFNP